MSKCVIIASYINDTILKIFKWQKTDFIICADGGYAHALKAQIRPNLLVGDFDSYTGPLPIDIEILQLPIQKNHTDTGVCIKHALDLGFVEIEIIGGIGGRFDHTVANMQSMCYALEHGAQITMHNEKNTITMITESQISIKKQYGWKLSLLSFSDICIDVSVRGVQYPLDNVILYNNFPLGISNEFEAETAIVEVGEGKLLVILSKD